MLQEQFETLEKELERVHSDQCFAFLDERLPEGYVCLINRNDSIISVCRMDKAIAVLRRLEDHPRVQDWGGLEQLQIPHWGGWVFPRDWPQECLDLAIARSPDGTFIVARYRTNAGPQYCYYPDTLEYIMSDRHGYFSDWYDSLEECLENAAEMEEGES